MAESFAGRGWFAARGVWIGINFAGQCIRAPAPSSPEAGFRGGEESELIMSLRSRLFLFFGAFTALLVAAQWWWVQSLTRDLREESDRLAMFVGASVAQVLTVDLTCEEGERCEPTAEVVHALADADSLDRRGAEDDKKEGGYWYWQHRAGKEGLTDSAPADVMAEAPERLRRLVRFLRPSSLEERPGDDTTQEVRVKKINVEAESVGAGAVIRMAPVWQSAAAHDGGEVTVVVTGGRAAEHGPGGSTAETWRHETESSHADRSRTIVHRRIISSQGVVVEERTEGIERDPVSHSTFFHLDQGRDDGDDDTRFLVLERPDRVAQVPIPESGIDALERFQNRLWLGSVLLTALGLLIAAWLAHRVSKPLRGMARAAAEVGDGALGTQVEASSRDREIQSTLEAFNHMSARLQALDSETRRLEASRHLGELGDVARGIAHTLRNPLNALGLSVEELAARGSGSAADDGLVDSARRQIRRLDRGIRSFLLLASQSGGAVDDVDLAELVRDVALEALQDNPGGARLAVRIADDLNAVVPAVEPELRAVIQALVVNALEASPPSGRVEVAVERSTASDGPGRWIVRVDDQGPGLPAEVRSRLFTPHLSTKANGSGMGLFLAHRIASHRYDGCLNLLDRELRGVRAELEIGPRRPIAEPELHGASPREATA